MWKTSFRLAAIILIVMSGSVFADSFHFDSAGGVIWDNVYVNPYTATDTTGGPLLPANTDLTVYCDDWNTEFSGNPTWSANVYSLAAETDAVWGTDLKYGTVAGALQPISRGGVAGQPGTMTSDTEQKELAAAMWTLFATGNQADALWSAINDKSISPGYAAAVSTDLGEAKAAVAGWIHWRRLGCHCARGRRSAAYAGVSIP